MASVLYRGVIASRRTAIRAASRALAAERARARRALRAREVAAE